LTAFASQADREQALALGHDAYLEKPVSPGDLIATVASVVGRAACSDEAGVWPLRVTRASDFCEKAAPMKRIAVENSHSR
jgi:DNA-binding response OmpR family regulator